MVPGYLELLHLDRPGAAEVLREMRDTAARSDTARRLPACFADSDWRLHLVGGVTSLLRPDLDVRADVWRAVDAGSWVTPQLVVVLWHTDPDLARELVARVDAGCPVQPRNDLPDAERHAASSPAGTMEQSAKMMASLLAIADRVDGLASWKSDALERSVVESLLVEDARRDGSAHVVASWARHLATLFETVGVPLGMRGA